VHLTAKGLSRTQATLAATWMVLAVPAVLWWKDSVPFLVFASVYANVAGHVSAWQGARAERASQ
jgi:hypothetical protein